MKNENVFIFLISFVSLASLIFAIVCFTHIKDRALFFDKQLWDKSPEIMHSNINERMQFCDYSTGSIINIGICRFMAYIFMTMLVVIDLIYCCICLAHFHKKKVYP